MKSSCSLVNDDARESELHVYVGLRLVMRNGASLTIVHPFLEQLRSQDLDPVGMEFIL